MDNNVVHSLCESLTQASLVSFRFNFRGVGQSQGQFGHGTGERKDVEAAISFVGALPQVDSQRIGLVGYSAGAGFGLPVGTKNARIKALAAISPPLSMFNFDFLKSCPKPRLLISGDTDTFTPAIQFLEFCHSLPQPKVCKTIDGADHFWCGRESRLAAEVTAFFVTVLQRQVGLT
jgi:uncharacterized protein